MRTSVQSLAIAMLLVISGLLICCPDDMTYLLDPPLHLGGMPDACGSMPDDDSLPGYGGSEVLVAIIVALTVVETLGGSRRWD
jgi:hypothetical protein